MQHGQRGHRREQQVGPCFLRGSLVIQRVQLVLEDDGELAQGLLDDVGLTGSLLRRGQGLPLIEPPVDQPQGLADAIHVQVIGSPTEEGELLAEILAEAEFLRSHVRGRRPTGLELLDVQGDAVPVLQLADDLPGVTQLEHRHAHRGPAEQNHDRVDQQ